MADNVVQFTTPFITPQRLLSDLQAEVDDLSGLLVIRIHKDGTYRPSFTRMEKSQLALASAVVDMTVRRIIATE